MPYCENCGAQINPTAKFCGSCGTPRTQNPAPTQPTVEVPLKAEPVAAPQSAPAPKRQRLNYYSPPNPSYVTSAPMPDYGVSAHHGSATLSAAGCTYAALTHTCPAPTHTSAGWRSNSWRHPLSAHEINGQIRQLRRRRNHRANDFCTTHSRYAKPSGTASPRPSQSRRQRLLRSMGRPTKSHLRLHKQVPHHAASSNPRRNPGNWALYNNTINQIDIHLKGAHKNSRAHREFEAIIHSSSGTYDFHMEENSDFTDILKAGLR